MREVKVWPHLVVVALLCAAVAGIAGALIVKHRSADSNQLPVAARVKKLDGNVGVDRNLVASASTENGQQTARKNRLWFFF